MNNPLMYDQDSCGGTSYPETEGYRYEKWYTSQGLTDGAEYRTLRFNVRQDNLLLHWTNGYLELHGRLVKKADASAFATGSKIALIHNAIPHMFSNIKLSVGSHVIEHINEPGHVSSMMFDVLFPRTKHKNGGLQYMWFPDTDKTSDTDSNKGFAVRQNYLIEVPVTSRGSFKLRIPLYVLFGFCENFYAMKGYPIEIELVRGSDHTALFRHEDCVEGKLTFSDFLLNIPIVDPCNSILLESLKGLKDSTPYLFSFRQRHGLFAPIPPDQYDFQLTVTTDNFHERPQMIWVGFQRNETETPYDQKFNHAIYTHEDVETAYVKLNNVQYPTTLFKADFAKNDNGFFYEMQEHLRANYLQYPGRYTEGNMLDPVRFKDLCTLLCFDVSKGDFSVGSTSVVTTLHIHFKVQTKKALRVYISWISDRTIEFFSDGKSLNVKSQSDSYK